MHNHPACRHMNIIKDYSVEELAAFHGHLGPYIIIGYRIGKYVRKALCDDPFQLTAKVYCSGNPPESCLADGVQLGSGCTLGKRNIEVIAGEDLKCEFFMNGKGILAIPKPFTPPARDENYSLGIEELALSLYEMKDIDLFDIEEI